jgi:type III pantothenate kinase
VEQQRYKLHKDNIWLALEIGNSRLHWAMFVGEKLYSTWDSDYITESVIQQLAQYQTLDDLPPEVLLCIYRSRILGRQEDQKEYDPPTPY